PPRTTHFPYTTLFRSVRGLRAVAAGVAEGGGAGGRDGVLVGPAGGGSGGAGAGVRSGAAGGAVVPRRRGARGARRGDGGAAAEAVRKRTGLNWSDLGS